MIVYCAGAPVPTVDARLFAVGLRHRLLTFADIVGRERAPCLWIDSQQADTRVFLDSGAFSVRSRGAAIDLGAYCDYIAARGHEFEMYAALDVIGDWRASARNLRLMHARGLAPLPVFHRGSPWRELDRLASEHGRVAFGGLPCTRQTLQQYLDLAFDRIERFWPVRVHLFGMTAPWALRRYPVYSADSSTAIVGAGMGRVLRFTCGQMVSRHWREDVRKTGDTSIADGLGPMLAGNGSAHVSRKCRSVVATIALESHVTALWRRRGVRWD